MSLSDFRKPQKGFKNSYLARLASHQSNFVTITIPVT